MRSSVIEGVEPSGACPGAQKKCFGFVRPEVPLEAAPACTAATTTVAETVAARRMLMRFMRLAPFVEGSGVSQLSEGEDRGGGKTCSRTADSGVGQPSAKVTLT